MIDPDHLEAAALALRQAMKGLDMEVVKRMADEDAPDLTPFNILAESVLSAPTCAANRDPGAPEGEPR